MKMSTSLIVLVLFAVAAALYYLSQHRSGPVLSPQEFKEKRAEDSGVVIDVRSKGEFSEGHLKITNHNFDVMSGEFEQKMDSLDKNKTYYLYCRTGNRSGKAASIMKNHGFEKVYNVGGFHHLVQAGFETQ